MASNRQAITAATDLLLKSPPGEFKEVLNDIRHLLADESILNGTILATCREYNTEQMLQVPMPDADYATLITKHGEVGVYCFSRNCNVGDYCFFQQKPLSILFACLFLLSIIVAGVNWYKSFYFSPQMPSIKRLPMVNIGTHEVTRWFSSIISRRK